eukprot:12836196-Prorocentrum_lima.AAC.1
MTSSLVGSEMCIRDSLGTQTMKTLMVMTMMTVMDVLLEIDINRVEAIPCLLYTSDAADDM